MSSIKTIFKAAVEAKSEKLHKKYYVDVVHHGKSIERSVVWHDRKKKANEVVRVFWGKSSPEKADAWIEQKIGVI